MRNERHRQFVEAPKRLAAHAGSAYPDQAEPLRAMLDGYFEPSAAESPQDGLIGIAAPHISPEGGRQAYRAAYRGLGPQHKDRVFAILGTSHLGPPNRFGLTRKPFVTPLGEARTELPLVDHLATRAGLAVEMEDYCHSTEHSIEFQVVFLQHLYGPDIRILPILCGSYARGLQPGARPEDDEPVKVFLAELREMAATERERLFWILGVDLAHMGRRYGDPFAAVAGQGAIAVEHRRAKRSQLRRSRLPAPLKKICSATHFWLARGGVSGYLRLHVCDSQNGNW